MGRILVVDDEEAVVSMLKVVFETEGYDVVKATSAKEAVRVLRKDSVDLVMTDMRMETETAGYEVVRAARRLPQPPAIVILTAYPLVPQEWRAAGADAVAPKPTNMKDLLNMIAELLRRRRVRLTRSS